MVVLQPQGFVQGLCDGFYSLTPCLWPPDTGTLSSRQTWRGTFSPAVSLTQSNNLGAGSHPLTANPLTSSLSRDNNTGHPDLVVLL